MIREKVYTNEIKQLEKEHKKCLRAYSNLRYEEDQYINWYINIRHSFWDDPYQIMLEKSKFKLSLDNLNLEDTDDEDLKEIIQLHKKVKIAEQIEQNAEKSYSDKLDSNVLQLVKDISPENSMLEDVYDNTRKKMTDFVYSDKDYLILDTYVGYLIIVNEVKILEPYGHPKILITDLRKRENINELLKDSYELSQEKKRGYYSSNDLKVLFKEFSPVPFHRIHFLHAQTIFEAYGRTQRFLIIGMMI